MVKRNLFIELLQVSLGTRDGLSRVPTAVEWMAVYEMAKKQAVLGVLACGIEKLPPECRPPQKMLLQWIGLVIQIEARNKLTTEVCAKLCKQLELDDFKVCVLKGQANHRYYPVGMGHRRSCGDIDIWVKPDVEGNERRKTKTDVARTLVYVDAHWKRTGLCWLHCNFTDASGVPIEVHFHPSFFSSPRYNKRFQKYFADINQCVTRAEIDGRELLAMRVEEDVIYQMNHVYRHLIDEGIGLRQIVDYYWLLRKFNDERLSVRDKATIMDRVSWFGMKRFAGALMYVLHELLGMPEEHLLCVASEKDGEFLMNEILISGNFGQGDPRMASIKANSYLQARVCQATRRFRRNLRFLTSYPGEVIWEPIVRAEHWIWKELRLWA